MERRTALKQLMFIAGGAALLPSCVKNNKPASLTLINLKISGDQEELVAEIAETIIPATDTPGAKDLNLSRFVLRMVDDCFEQDDRQKFSEGLIAFEKMSNDKFGNAFLELDKTKRAEFLKELDAIKSKGSDEEKNAPVNQFYSTVKDLTIRGYMTSEYVMTNKLYYNMVPGKFKGCVEVTDVKDYKTILG